MTSRAWSADSNLLSLTGILRAGAELGPVLGIDTGTPVVSVGVVSGGKIKASLARRLPSHCAGLPAAVDEVLGAAALAMRDVAGIAVALGPGSFTGLRIGLSYAKGIVSASRQAILGVSTLDAMALCSLSSVIPEGAVVCPVLDARKGEVYVALYRFVTDALKRASGDLVVSLERLPSLMTADAVFVGEEKAEEACALFAANGGSAVVGGTAQMHLRGSFVAAIGAARMARGDRDDVASLEPFYVRPSDAAVNSIAADTGERRHGTPRGRTDPATPRA